MKISNLEKYEGDKHPLRCTKFESQDKTTSPKTLDEFIIYVDSLFNNLKEQNVYLFELFNKKLGLEDRVMFSLSGKEKRYYQVVLNNLKHEVDPKILYVDLLHYLDKKFKLNIDKELLEGIKSPLYRDNPKLNMLSEYKTPNIPLMDINEMDYMFDSKEENKLLHKESKYFLDINMMFEYKLPDWLIKYSILKSIEYCALFNYRDIS